jgi:hypothetical protein
MKQEQLFKIHAKTAFGGSLLKNSHAKKARPYSNKAAIHLILKSTARNLRRLDRVVEQIIEQQAKKHFIRIYSLENVGNHIHLVVKSKHSVYLKRFLKSICGLIPRSITGAQRGRPKLTKFWAMKPFTRIIKWGHDFKTLKKYMTINHYQSLGYFRWQAEFMVKMDRILTGYS